jgi:hypothetical protein
MDGHGREGHLVSQFLKEKVQMHFLNLYKSGRRDWGRMLSEIVIKCD